MQWALNQLNPLQVIVLRFHLTRCNSNVSLLSPCSDPGDLSAHTPATPTAISSCCRWEPAYTDTLFINPLPARSPSECWLSSHVHFYQLQVMRFTVFSRPACRSHCRYHWWRFLAAAGSARSGSAQLLRLCLVFLPWQWYILRRLLCPSAEFGCALGLV